MDLNELKGRVIKVNLARPMKGLMQQPGGNRASEFANCIYAFFLITRLVWESEEWLQANALPLSQSGGRHTRTRSRRIWLTVCPQAYAGAMPNQRVLLRKKPPRTKTQWKCDLMPCHGPSKKDLQSAPNHLDRRRLSTTRTGESFTRLKLS
jgi:hypothetical protein